jgi:hypothetical protein
MGFLPTHLLSITSQYVEYKFIARDACAYSAISFPLIWNLLYNVIWIQNVMYEGVHDRKTYM